MEAEAFTRDPRMTCQRGVMPGGNGKTPLCGRGFIPVMNFPVPGDFLSRDLGLGKVQNIAQSGRRVEDYSFIESD
jgi:hypothetical protein